MEDKSLPDIRWAAGNPWAIKVCLEILLQGEKLSGCSTEEIVNVLLGKSLSAAEHLHGIRTSPVGIRIIAADHRPVSADPFGDVGQCGIVRAKREIEIAETFLGAAPRLLSCGRAGVVGSFEAIHQPRNKPNADFEETPAK